MTWQDGTRVRWHGYGSPALVALAEKMNEQERVEAEARRQGNRGGVAMDTLFDQEEPTITARVEASVQVEVAPIEGSPAREDCEHLLIWTIGGVLVCGKCSGRWQATAHVGPPVVLADPGERQLGPFVRDSETSRQAALANYPRQGSQRRRILDAFATGKGRTHGFTREELARWTGLPDNSIRPRVGELIAGGWIGQGSKDGAPATRQTRLGNDSEVLMLTPAGLARIEATGAS